MGWTWNENIKPSPPRFDQRDKISEEQVLFPIKLPKLKQIGDILVCEAMPRTRGNQSAAAAILGISPTAISKCLKK